MAKIIRPEFDEEIQKLLGIYKSHNSFRLYEVFPNFDKSTREKFPYKTRLTFIFKRSRSKWHLRSSRTVLIALEIQKARGYQFSMSYDEYALKYPEFKLRLLKPVRKPRKKKEKTLVDYLKTKSDKLVEQKVSVELSPDPNFTNLMDWLS